MNLGEALAEKITALGKSAEPKSPVDSDRGRIARMNRLERAHGGPAGAAAAVGVDRETWRRWGKTGINPRTGKPYQKPGKPGLGKLVAAVQPLYRATFRRSVQQALRGLSKVKVWAVVNWNGYYNKQNGGYRTNGVHLDRLPVGAMTRLYTPWVEDDTQALAALFEAAVSSAYDDDVINFEGDDVRINW